jgi:glutaredoxin-like protein NrdH
MKFLLGIIVLFVSSVSFAETFRLESGLEVEGTVISQDEKKIVLETKDGKRTLPKDMIDRGEKVPTKQESMIIIEYLEPKVEFFLTETCPYCKKMRDFLISQGITYHPCDIYSTYCRQKYDQLHGTGVPLLKIGTRVIRGYDPQGVLNALGRKKR